MLINMHEGNDYFQNAFFVTVNYKKRLQSEQNELLKTFFF